MSNKNEPANPVVHGHIVEALGLTKRELIAAMAMQALISNPEAMRDIQEAIKGTNAETQREVLKSAVNAADMLLEALYD